jgi:hypothetical protein
MFCNEETYGGVEPLQTLFLAIFAPQLELRVAVDAWIESFCNFVWKWRNSFVEQLTDTRLLLIVEETINGLVYL